MQQTRVVKNEKEREENERIERSHSNQENIISDWDGKDIHLLGISELARNVGGCGTEKQKHENLLHV